MYIYTQYNLTLTLYDGSTSGFGDVSNLQFWPLGTLPLVPMEAMSTI